MDRKEFIKTSGRWMILGVLTAFTGGLVLKRRISVNKDACSISSGRCRECAILASCNLPEAVKLRNDEKEKGI
jgi:hypothetical protein